MLSQHCAIFRLLLCFYLMPTLLFGWSHVPCQVSQTASSHEKRQRYRTCQNFNDNLSSMPFTPQLPQQSNPELMRFSSWTGHGLRLDKHRALFCNNRTDPLVRTSLQTNPANQSHVPYLFFGWGPLTAVTSAHCHFPAIRRMLFHHIQQLPSATNPDNDPHHLLFNVLGCAKNSTQEIIHENIRCLLHHLHPDKKLSVP